MKRETTSRISWILDYFLPPIIRENRFFYKFILKRAVKGDVDAYLDFRDNAWKMSPEEIQDFYASIYSNIQRPTDCSEASVERILKGLKGHSILEFGCGRGHLADLIINKGFTYTGVDFDTSHAKNICKNTGKFIDGTSLENISGTFDTIICSHTLEHVRDIRTHVAELREKTNQRLIIVIPLQLNHYYTPDLHTYFFRRPGDFFLAAGFERSDNITYWIDGTDLCVYLDCPT